MLALTVSMTRRLVDVLALTVSMTRRPVDVLALTVSMTPGGQSMC